MCIVLNPNCTLQEKHQWKNLLEKWTHIDVCPPEDPDFRLQQPGAQRDAVSLSNLSIQVIKLIKCKFLQFGGRDRDRDRYYDRDRERDRYLDRERDRRDRRDRDRERERDRDRGRPVYDSSDSSDDDDSESNSYSHRNGKRLRLSPNHSKSFLPALPRTVFHR